MLAEATAAVELDVTDIGLKTIDLSAMIG